MTARCVRALEEALARFGRLEMLMIVEDAHWINPTTGVSGTQDSAGEGRVPPDSNGPSTGQPGSDGRTRPWWC
jgi:hypothetical protein